MSQQLYYVYIHKRLDTNEVFYVGKGTRNRSHSKLNRNSHWNNIVNKHGFKAEILCTSTDESSILDIEALLIGFYPNLVNVYPGGNLSPNFKGEKNPFFGKKHSEETRAKLRTKRYTPEVRKLMSDKAKLRVLSETHKQNISKAGKGRVSATKGKRHPNNYKFAGTCTTPYGTFDTVKEASIALKLPYQTIISRCRSPHNIDWRLEKCLNS